jgi:hypothetical protein
MNALRASESSSSGKYCNSQVELGLKSTIAGKKHFRAYSQNQKKDYLCRRLPAVGDKDRLSVKFNI